MVEAGIAGLSSRDGSIAALRTASQLWECEVATKIGCLVLISYLKAGIRDQIADHVVA